MSCEPYALSVTFRLKHHVPFGSSLYITGSIPELGSGDPSLSQQLDWNPDDVWAVTIQILTDQTDTRRIKYKYFISGYNTPEPVFTKEQEPRFLQIGKFSTINKKSLTLDERWESQRIKLQVPLLKNPKNYSMCVLGSIPELGCHNGLPLKMDIISPHPLTDPKKKFYELQFWVPTTTKYFCYNYLLKFKINGLILPDRSPERSCNLSNGKCGSGFFSSRNVYKKIDTPFDRNFNFLKISKNVAIGPLPIFDSDFETLRTNGISHAIFLLSTNEKSLYKFTNISGPEYRNLYRASRINLRVKNLEGAFANL